MNIRKLAKKLNLSITTVSRALGNYSDVSKKTKQRVLDFAKKYNYSPNPHASRLASGKSNSLGFVLPIYGINSSILNQSSFFEFIAGLSDRLHSENIQFTMMFAKNKKEEKEAYEKLVNVQKINKLIIHNTKKYDDRINFLKKNKVHFVSWGRSESFKNYSWVDLDNEKSAEMIVDYLVKRNHRNIAYINISEEYNFAYLRKNGFLKGLKKNNLKFKKKYYKTVGSEDPEFTKDIIIKTIVKNPEISSIICATEYTAIGCINACKELNKEIGKDISIISYGGPILDHLSSPSITTVANPLKDLGEKAIEILFDTEKDKSKVIGYLETPIITERDSVHTV
tara:strand:- start:312 stop:1328 length:1017 start_codon:yes stop_codon:yes gene_type:complete